MGFILKKMQEANWLEIEAQVAARIRFMADIARSYDSNDIDESRLGEKGPRVACTVYGFACKVLFWYTTSEPVGPPVKATVHSDDFAYKTEFDASAWFSQSSDEEILAIAGVDWGGDYPADEVAKFYYDRDTIITQMFKYLDSISRDPAKKDVRGFECHVDRDDAMEWLALHGPELHAKILEGEQGLD